MNELAFAGYTAHDAAPDDRMRLKWNAMRADLSTPGLSLPDASAASVAALNLQINRQIKFDESESEDLSVWQTARQTLASGHGDCKDYALLKYAVLTQAGIAARVVIGEIREILANKHHAWCAALLGGTWFALDNMFDHLEPVATYPNWTPVNAMHDDSVVWFGKEFTISEIEGLKP